MTRLRTYHDLFCGCFVIFCLELYLSAKTTATTFTKNTDVRQRKKPAVKGKKKSNNSNGRRGYAGEEDDSISGGDDFGTTQIMTGSTQEGQRTDRPIVMPPSSPTWVIVSVANLRHPSVSAILLLLLLPTTL